MVEEYENYVIVAATHLNKAKVILKIEHPGLLKRRGSFYSPTAEMSRSSRVLALDFPPYHHFNPPPPPPPISTFYPEETSKRREVKSMSMTEMEKGRNPVC